MFKSIALSFLFLLLALGAFSQTIATSAITPTTFCSGTAMTVNYTITGVFVPGNTFTAQLSDAAGSFTTPTAIGSTNSITAGSISATVPAGTASGAGYKVRVIGSSPNTTGTPSATTITINAQAMSAPTFAGTTFCANTTFNLTNVFPTGCAFSPGNIFTVQMSDNSGNFGAPVAVGASASTTGGAIVVTIPKGTVSGTAYRFRVISSAPVATSPINASAITINAIFVNGMTVATSLCAGSSFNMPFTLNGGCAATGSNTFTAQLSDAAGGFGAPTTIGTLTSATAGNVPVTIPVNTPAGTGYRIRVATGDPGTNGNDNGANITISAISLSAPSLPSASLCQSGSYTLTYSSPNTCPFLTGNIFTAQLSDQFGNFSSPVSIGTRTATGFGTFAVSIPAATTPGNAYRVRVVASNPAVTSPDNGVNLSINALGINAPSFTPTSFCQNQTFNIAYAIQNSCGFPNTPASNIFTAQLSDASGSFASPTTIGTVTSNNSGNISAAIPAAQTPGSGYRIRIVSTNPGTGLTSPDNGTNLSIVAQTGNPTVFGTGVWNAYEYNSATFTNYSGFYTENNLSFNTTTRFAAANAPSTADASTGVAYSGCAVATSPYSISFKRTNFTCGYYQIDVPSHDDNIVIYVNGTQVYSSPITGALTNVWSGFLGAASTVEITLVNTGGPGNLAVNFSTSAVPITTSPPVSICPAASTTLTASSSVPLTFAWTPTANLTPSSGAGASVVAHPPSTTTYTVTGTDATTGCTTSANVLVTVSSTFTTTVTSTLPTICSGVSTTTLTASGANTYSWSPSAGLSATTGNVVTANPTVTTTYTVTGNNGCTTNTAPSTVTVQTIPGTPAQNTFGTTAWNVYVYNSIDYTNFYGFYSENNVSFNTTSRWAAGSGPTVANASTGSAYSGCSVPTTNYSLRFLRTNFTCGYYQIDVPYHDDNATLIIDGTQQFQHNGCCDVHTNVWTGFLGPNSKVEFQLINGSGPGSLQIQIAASTTNPLVVNPSVVICSGTQAELSATSAIPGVTYSWVNSAGNTNLIATPNAQNTFAGPLTANETYTATLTDAGTTGCTISASVPVTVSPTPNTIVTPGSGSSFCAGTSYTLTASGANGYTWSPSTDLSATTGFQVVASPQVTTTYTVTGSNNCGSKDATITLTVNATPPINVFPSGTWNVYGFNTTTIGTGSYQGYYTENGNGTSGYDFNTTTRWASGAAPSTANATNGQAWRGCTMPATNMALSFKRTNFACGVYQINITTHDDGFILLINGTQVAAHSGCCDAHTGIWTGVLSSASTVEWQLVQGGGGSGLQVAFVPVAQTASVWTGAASNDWFNAANWCSAVPTSTTDALIPAAGPLNFPSIGGAGAQVRTVTINPAIASGTYNSAIPSASLATAGSNNLDVFGNWANNGTYTANTGTITFRGTNAGNTIVDLFPTAFYNVVLNKTNGITNATGLMQVANNFNFVTGIITDNAAINILAGGLATGASNASYVDGQITKTGNTAFTFPVGKAGLLRPISISGPALATDNFTAQYFNTNPNPLYPNAQRQAGIDHVSGAEYWYLNRSGGTDPVSVTLSWGANSGGTANPASLRVGRWDIATSKWINEGSSGTTGNATAGTVTSATTISTFGSPNQPFTLATIDLSNVLPIELTDFAAVLVSPGVAKISWATQSELNNDHFEVLRSIDAKTFGAIATAAGNGTTAVVHQYSTTDLHAPVGKIYYRLKQVDFDGSTGLSEIVVVDNLTAVQVRAYPNPTGELFSIDLNGKKMTSFGMIDLMEKEVTVPVTITDEKITVNVSSLSAGIYIVRISLDGTLHQLKVVRK